jgi:hypothetical protein
MSVEAYRSGGAVRKVLMLRDEMPKILGQRSMKEGL